MESVKGIKVQGSRNEQRAEDWGDLDEWTRPGKAKRPFDFVGSGRTIPVPSNPQRTEGFRQPSLARSPRELQNPFIFAAVGTFRAALSCALVLEIGETLYFYGGRTIPMPSNPRSCDPLCFIVILLASVWRGVGEPRRARGDAEAWCRQRWAA